MPDVHLSEVREVRSEEQEERTFTPRSSSLTTLIQLDSHQVLTAFAAHLRLLEQAGYTVRQVPVPADIAAIAQRHCKLIAAKMARGHAAWFASYALYYRPHTAALVREGQAVSPAAMAAGRAGQSWLRNDLMVLMTEVGIDLWVCPATTQTAPPGIDSTGDPDEYALDACWPAHAHITHRCGGKWITTGYPVHCPLYGGRVLAGVVAGVGRDFVKGFLNHKGVALCATDRC